MDDMITDQLEWLVSCNLQGNRLARHLLILSGCLAGEGLPENISSNGPLCPGKVLQDVFDALVSSLNQLGGGGARQAGTTRQRQLSRGRSASFACSDRGCMTAAFRL
ncbi:MAG: hypothetical protein IPO00_15280 [Betaproteobacteria bacterium]|nr:hypothetical protein [Betaproteobacteria bacterium]